MTRKKNEKYVEKYVGVFPTYTKTYIFSLSFIVKKRNKVLFI